MNDFFDFEMENMGGCTDFTFCPIQNVIKIPDAINGKVNSPIQLYTGNEMLAGKAILNSLLLDETPATSEAGESFKIEVSGMVPKLTAEYINLFSKMIKQRFILIIRDSNGLKRICGNKEFPLKFQFSQTSAISPAGINGFKFSFTGIYHSPSPFYNA